MSSAELVRKVTEGVEKALQPPFAALSASVDTAALRIEEIAAKVAQIEARLAALALPEGAKPRALNFGEVADGAPARARAAPRAKKEAGAPPANAMYLFYHQFSTQPEVRAAVAAAAVARARSLAGLPAGEPDEKGWKKVAAQLWKTMDGEMKKVWQAKHKALSGVAPTEELGLDAGDAGDAEAFDEVELDA